jgi:ribosomal protein S12 methylthiotransferase
MAAVHEALPRPHDPYTDLVPPAGIKLTPRHYAYLKIAEGCNHRCTFCIIPALRGALVSRPVDEVLEEAERLVASGVKELLVIAQDTSAYGVDLRYRTGFWRGRPVKAQISALARALGRLGVWVRLHYVYPYPHVDELIPLMAEGVILPYLDVPLQHASPRLLRLMKRPATGRGGEDMLARIRRWREICPELTLRSTFIVGFPGETEDDFARLLEFLEAAELDRVGAFAYSPVDGAAANRLPGAVPEEIKQERLARLMEKQAAISARRLARRVGRREKVLVDRLEGGMAIGRTAAEAPEVDGVVYIDNASGATPGEFYDVLIERATEHDLYAQPLTRAHPAESAKAASRASAARRLDDRATLGRKSRLPSASKT